MVGFTSLSNGEGCLVSECWVETGWERNVKLEMVRR